MKRSASFSARTIVLLMTACACLLLPAVAHEPPHAGLLSDAGDGLTVNKPSAFQGYTLVAPMNSTSTYLIDMNGCVVNEWKSDYTPALSACLLENGHLLRPACDRQDGIVGAGAGGRIQEFTWEGKLVWDFSYGDSKLRPHHEICRLPNGNVLAVASDIKSGEHAIAAGRNPKSIRSQLIPECILEVKPTGTTTGEIVWRWYSWDHLVQDFDKSKPNFGDVSEHPELIDLNFSTEISDRLMSDPQQLAKLRSLGYVGGSPPNSPVGVKEQSHANPGEHRKSSIDPLASQRGDPTRSPKPGTSVGEQSKNSTNSEPERAADHRPPGPMQGDWMHVNSVAYNAKLDQIMISVHDFSEVWVIDHSTTTAEAASHKGGRRGKGGDLLYRWGNPRVYRSGSNADQRLFAQHCAHWIEDGRPGAGHMLVFNNGIGRPGGESSSVEEVVLPVNSMGQYAKDEFVAYAPENAVWTYSAPEKSSFLSILVSGAQRLPNGNTFICSGLQRLLFEVTPDNEIVWQFKYSSQAFGPSTIPSMLVPVFLHRVLEVTNEQRKSIQGLQRAVNSQLSWLLTDEQLQKLKEPPQRPPGDRQRPFRPRRVGEVMHADLIEDLKLSAWQLSELKQIQQYVNDEFDKIWRDDQKEILEQMRKKVGGGSESAVATDSQRENPSGAKKPNENGSGSSSPVGPPEGGKPRPPLGSVAGAPIHPPAGIGGIFRSFRYGPDYRGLAGKNLKPGRKLVEVATSDDRPESDSPHVKK